MDKSKLDDQGLGQPEGAIVQNGRWRGSVLEKGPLGAESSST